MVKVEMKDTDTEWKYEEPFFFFGKVLAACCMCVIGGYGNILGCEPWFWRDVSERATDRNAVDPTGASCWRLLFPDTTPQHTPSNTRAVILGVIWGHLSRRDFSSIKNRTIDHALVRWDQRIPDLIFQFNSLLLCFVSTCILISMKLLLKSDNYDHKWELWDNATLKNSVKGT